MIGYFLFLDLGVYLVDRALHLPVAVKWIHRRHHRFTSPTAFGQAAFSPIEFGLYYALALAPTFVVPLHWGAVISVVRYSQVCGLIGHCGVNSGICIPGHVTTKFHDDHHRYFHGNFGHALDIWDRLLGTARTPTTEDRVQPVRAMKTTSLDSRRRTVAYIAPG